MVYVTVQWVRRGTGFKVKKVKNRKTPVLHLHLAILVLLGKSLDFMKPHFTYLQDQSLEHLTLSFVIWSKMIIKLNHICLLVWLKNLNSLNYKHGIIFPSSQIIPIKCLLSPSINLGTSSLYISHLILMTFLQFGLRFSYIYLNTSVFHKSRTHY